MIPYNALNSEFANFETPCIFIKYIQRLIWDGKINQSGLNFLLERVIFTTADEYRGTRKVTVYVLLFSD
jgi:hypothetical protein